MNKAREQISPTEWDFRALIHKNPTPEQRRELHAAIFYEYARESDSIRDLVREYVALPAAMRRDIEGGRDNLTGHCYPMCAGPVSKKLARMDLICCQSCILWPRYFPKTPWLQIPPRERAARLALSKMDQGPGFLLEINEHGGEPAKAKLTTSEFMEIDEADWIKGFRIPPPGGRVHLGSVEHLLVSINWAGGNNKDLSAAFADWLRKSRPKEYPEPRGDASRWNVDAAYLTRLAVMRLLHSFTYTAAAALADRHQCPMPAEHNDALKVRQRVRADLRKLFLGEAFENQRVEALIPKSEFPRSYPTITEEKRRAKK